MSPAREAKEGLMDFARLDPAELLLAERAVLGYREVSMAAAGAAHGRGLEVLEAAVLAQGRRQMVLVMEEALKARSGAEQKGGARANAASVPRTATTGR